MVTTAENDTTTADDPFTAWDWQIVIRGASSLRMGAIGRTSSRERSRRNITKALEELPAGTKAHGELLKVDVLNPDAQRLVAVAARGRHGISWARV